MSWPLKNKMHPKKLTTIIFIFLLATALFGVGLRLLKITTLEPYIDEASIGYNAYLVANYHIDEWGSKWPLHFQAFGEWKLPVYVYSVAVLGKICGFNTLAIRLPSVLAGLGTGLLLFLFSYQKLQSLLLSIFLTNIYLLNYWSFMISRGGFEANLSLFLVISAIFAYVEIKKDFNLLLASLFLILAFFSYNAASLLAPIIFLLLVGHYVLANKTNLAKSKIIFNLVLAGVLWLPVVFLSWRFYHNPTALSRLSQVHSHNFQLGTIVFNYLKSFSYSFWVGQGDSIARHTQPGFGNVNVFSYFLFIGGVVSLLVKIAKKQLSDLKNLTILLFLWLVALIPGFITSQPLHNLRDIFLLPLFFYFIFYFLIQLKRTFNFRELSIIIGFSNILLIIFSIPFFWSYFTFYLEDPTLSWGRGYNHLISTLKQKYPQKTIYIDTQRVQPYIYWAWYLKIPPQKLVRNIPNNWALSSVAQIDNFFFKQLNQPKKCYQKICYQIKQ